jgi:hypothetical protein
MNMNRIFGLLFLLSAFFLVDVSLLKAQETPPKSDKKQEDKTKKSESASKSIGGKEHDAEILGVKIGMDVPTALQAVFVNANRKPGQEKPDSKRNEGKDKKDVRVLYKNLPQGDLQIVFAEGKVVKEILLTYANPPNVDDLRLPYTGDIGIAIDGERYDDRYSVGFTDNQKVQRVWWRDEKTSNSYSVRVQFFSPNRIKDAGAKFVVTAVQKLLFIKPGDEAKFAKTFLEK